MNPEHTAKTLAALDSILSFMQNAVSVFLDHRIAFTSLFAPPGTTYYRKRCIWDHDMERDKEVAEWLIVRGAYLTSPIQFRGWRYISYGHTGPGPDEAFFRVEVAGLDYREHHCEECGENELEYFLLVEEVPEKP